MNDDIKKAVERDNRTIQKIMPICKNDGEIITEIINIFTKLKQNNVVEILKQYKKIDDEKIIEKLLDW